jgi:FAD/FMN-containing dehydrogenase/Fe-S oxidoreductase
VVEQQRQHIRDDLKGLFKGELLFDELSRVLYSTDASVFQVKPFGVALPKDEEDVTALVRYAAEHKIPLIPRGAGSGLAGEALGSGIIVDFSRHFRSIVETGSSTVRVQPGVVYRELNRHLAGIGRRFAPDPASGDQCTIGGMVANNASGPHLLLHGYTRDHVASLRVVLDTGDAVSTSRHPRHPDPASSQGHLEDIVIAVSDLIDQNRELIRVCRPRTRFDRCGYLLHDVLANDTLDVARLLTGSEGTLAVITEATLRTIPLPVGRSLVLLGFASLEAALKAAQLAVLTSPSACELMDHRLLTLARGCAESLARLVPPDAEAVLLVEYESSSILEARESALRFTDRVYRTTRLALHTVSAFTQPDMERIWSMRQSAISSLYRLRGTVQPVSFIEDVGVPLEELPAFVHRLQEILQRHETTASFLVHAGTGQVHTRPFLDLERPDDIAKLSAIAEEVHSMVLDLGGTISSQHAVGLARNRWVSRQHGRLFPAMRALKNIFDPNGIFNPGKIIGLNQQHALWPLRRKVGEFERGSLAADDHESKQSRNGESHLPKKDSRPSSRPGRKNASGAPDLLPSGIATRMPALRWQPGEFRNEVANCNGCGVCRTEASNMRMCPIFRGTHGEDATPRAKANLMRQVLDEETDSRFLSSDEVRGVADLCVNCKMCAHECPAHVNIPKLMLEAKAANVLEHGLTRSDWVLARTESFAALGSSLAFIVNAALGSRTVRWFMEKVFGVSRKRLLPAFAARNFLTRAARRGWTRPPQSKKPRVAYFVDVFANYNDPLLAEAVVAVLHHQGIEVYIPPGQIGCGIAPLAQGDVETAREAAEINLRVLADIAREGYTIVCSEPSAALMLRHDYRDIIDDPDTGLVAARTVELTGFLWDLKQYGRLQTDFRPLPFVVGHHVPCHLKALGGGAPKGPDLLALIPELRVHSIDVSCSGMAGTYGLKAENYEVSLEAGRPMLQEFANPEIQYGSSECSTCRLQMEDAGRKRALHPIQYLAIAYGLLPELRRRLQRPIGDLVIQ